MAQKGQWGILSLSSCNLFITTNATLLLLVLVLQSVRRAGESQGGEGKSDEDRELHVENRLGFLVLG